MKIFFKGGEGIINPVDMEESPIKEGDILSFDYGDYESYMGEPYPEHRKSIPIYEVRLDRSTGLLFGSGLYSDLYLHDFRFKYCKCLTHPQQGKEENRRL